MIGATLCVHLLICAENLYDISFSITLFLENDRWVKMTVRTAKRRMYFTASMVPMTHLNNCPNPEQPLNRTLDV